MRRTPGHSPAVAAQPLTASDQPHNSSPAAEEEVLHTALTAVLGLAAAHRRYPTTTPTPTHSRPAMPCVRSLGLGPFLLPTWTSLPTLSSAECLPILKTCWTTLEKCPWPLQTEVRVGPSAWPHPHLLCKLLTLRTDTALPASVPQNLERYKTCHSNPVELSEYRPSPPCTYKS